MSGFFKVFYNRDKSGLTPLSKSKYDSDFGRDVSHDVAERAFNKAWESRNFEIELYWKRATYFWAFIASTFAGYFLLTSSENYKNVDDFNHVEVYFVVCIGLIISIAWVLTNKGSKSWQRHWEIHVDLLEDRFTGPLYKTVHPTLTYSVSKINEIVSIVVAFVWLALGIKYLVEQDLLNWSITNINWFVALSTFGMIVALSSMFFGYGRGRFTERGVTMSRRIVEYEDPSDG